MSIQQSINQMLMSAQIGTGLYKQTPEAKARAELKATEKAAEQAGKKTTEALAAAVRSEQDLNKSIFESPIADTIQSFGAQEVQSREKLLKLDPSDKNYQAYQKAKQGMEAFQRSKQRFLQDKEERQKILQAQLEMQEKLLQGVPEVPVKRTKVEVTNNGEE